MPAIQALKRYFDQRNGNINTMEINIVDYCNKKKSK